MSGNSLSKPEIVVEYYVLCHKLKNTIRTGWERWDVKADRLESVAEHVYGVMMLAVVMQSEYQYNLDFGKALFMIAIHELEEIAIGDLTPFDIDQDEKKWLGHEAVADILKNLADRDNIMNLVLEFDEGKSAEAKFARQCDKLEASLQCKIYDNPRNFSLHGQEDIPIVANDRVRELLRDSGSWSSAWIEFCEERTGFDKNFLEVSNYIKNQGVQYSSKHERKK